MSHPRLSPSDPAYALQDQASFAEWLACYDWGGVYGRDIRYPGVATYDIEGLP